MKNIHNIGGYLYITHDEKIEDNDWYLGTLFSFNGQEEKPLQFNIGTKPCGEIPCGIKIILSTDPKLIENGVQKISEWLVNWYVENPVHNVEIEMVKINPMGRKVDPFNLSQNQSGCTWKYGVKLVKTEPAIKCIQYDDYSWVAVISDYEDIYVPRQYLTTDIWQGHGSIPMFSTEEECQKWCDENQLPKDIPLSEFFNNCNCIRYEAGCFSASCRNCGKFPKQKNIVDKTFSLEEVQNIARYAFHYYKRNDLDDDELEEEFEKWLGNLIKK